MTNQNPTGIPRAIEIVVAFFGLLCVGLVLAVLGILIKVSSRGPILFRQQRVGRHGNLFTLLKLRSMYVGQDGPLVTAARDSRITPLGRILRKTKFDELPGLWNVLVGEMSIVGPRPEVPEYVDLNDAKWQEVLGARPGITDPTTLRLRNEERLLADVPDKDRFYREVLQPYKLNGYINYLRGRSWKSDLRIIAMTITAVMLPTKAANLQPKDRRWQLAE